MFCFTLKECGVNITEVNPDYVKNKVKSPDFLDKHNFVECVCTTEEKEKLFTNLQDDYKASDVHCLSKQEGKNKKCTCVHGYMNAYVYPLNLYRTFTERKISKLLYCSFFCC